MMMQQISRLYKFCMLRCKVPLLAIAAVSAFTYVIFTSQSKVKLRSPDQIDYSDSPVYDPSGGNILGNLSNFTFLTTSNICVNNNVSVIFIVPSHPEHVTIRNVLRNAYNRVLHGKVLRVVFLVGNVKKDSFKQIIKKESAKFGDIVQGNFADGYHSISYNHLQGLKWATTMCKQAEYVIKADDDTYLNLDKIIQTIYSKKYDFTNKLFCFLFFHANVVRDPKEKYYVSFDMYPYKEYPTYCNGWVVVYPFKSALRVSHASSLIKFVWMSDVFVAGLAPQAAKLDFINMNPYYTFQVEDVVHWQEQGKELPTFYAGPSGGNASLLRALFEKSDVLIRSHS